MRRGRHSGNVGRMLDLLNERPGLLKREYAALAGLSPKEAENALAHLRWKGEAELGEVVNQGKGGQPRRWYPLGMAPNPDGTPKLRRDAHPLSACWPMRAPAQWQDGAQA